jgi:dTDP-4-amino-4,6-dideoxygalactose transaminase
MSDINAAIGLAQLKKIDNLNGRRDEIAARYSKKLAGVGGIRLPAEKKNRKNSNHLYPIILEDFDRNLFVKKLDARGVGTSVHFIPLHLQPFFKSKFRFQRGDFPVAEWVYERIVSLPIYPSMTNKQVDRVCDIIKETICR